MKNSGMAIERETPNLLQDIIKSHFKGAKSRSGKAPSRSTMERKTESAKQASESSWINTSLRERVQKTIS